MMDIPNTRLCNKCNQILPLTTEYFHKSKRGTYGYVSACKDCMRAFYGHRKLTVPDASSNTRECSVCRKILPFTSEYFAPSKQTKWGLRADCRECIAARRREDYKVNPSPKIEAAKKWVSLNPDKDKIARREWIERNPDRVKSIKDRYVESNPEKVRKAKSEYAKRNPEVIKAKTRNRRARIKMADGVHTADDVKHQYNLQHGKCFYCDIDLNGKFHVDHFHPISKGGSNGADNLVISCKTCNLRKSDMLPDVWVELITKEMTS